MDCLQAGLHRESSKADEESAKLEGRLPGANYSLRDGHFGVGALVPP